jgi:flagellar biosynthesis component FlhA
VLRALARERTPLRRGRDILEALAATAGADEAQSLREVRLRLRDELAGNAPGCRRIAIPPDIEAELAEWMTDDPHGAFLAAPAEEIQQWVERVGKVVAGNGSRALVVKRPKLRPALRNLLDLEFPGVLSLTSEEIGEASPQGTVAHA